MRVCNNRWVINISQFLNFLICDDYESLLSECPVQRRSAAVEKSCTSFQQQSIYIHHSTREILPGNFLYTDTPSSRKQRCNIVEIGNMISSLIFCFIVGAVLAAEEDSRSAYIKTQENKRLHGYVVKKIDSTDEMSCSQACLRHSWCTSSNFKESSGNCELNKHEFSTTDDDTKLTDNPGTTFSMFLKVRKVLNFHCLDNKGVRVQTSIISAYKKN